MGTPLEIGVLLVGGDPLRGWGVAMGWGHPKRLGCRVWVGFALQAGVPPWDGNPLKGWVLLLDGASLESWSVATGWGPHRMLG